MHKETHIAKLYSACQRSWDASTSYNEDYDARRRVTAGDRAYGQCAVTSLVEHDWLGGQFMQGLVWLHDDDLGEIDFTWHQFPAYARRTDVEPVTRERLLPAGNRWMRDRYELLSRRVAGILRVAVPVPALLAEVPMFSC